MVPDRATPLPALTKNLTGAFRDSRGRRFFVKRAHAADHASVAREIRALRLLASTRARLALPMLARASERHGVLALQWLPGAETLDTLQRRKGTWDPGLARRLGVALGELHRATRGLAAPLAPGPPDLLEDFLWTPVRFYAALSGAGVALLQRIHGNQRLLDRLDQLVKVDPPAAQACLIHGDLKPANVLRLPRGRLVVVDWELARPGPAERDLGSLLAEWWVWHCSPDFGERASPAAFRRTVRALWDGYSSGARVRPVSQRALEWAGAALLIHLYGVAHHDGHFGPRSVGLFRAAADLCVRPGAWRRRWGLPR